MTVVVLTLIECKVTAGAIEQSPLGLLVGRIGLCTKDLAATVILVVGTDPSSTAGDPSGSFEGFEPMYVWP